MPTLKKTLHGKHQAIHYREFSTDRRSILSVRVDYEIFEDFDKADLALLSVFKGPAIAGIPFGPLIKCVGISRRYNEESGLATYSYSFEGAISETDFDKSGDDPQFELEVTMREEPIETHPNFKAISDKYFWNSTTKEFARYIVKDKKGGLSGGKDDTQQATSPMFGVTSYLVPGVTYRRSYGKINIPTNLLDRVGMIVEPPGIGQFPDLSRYFSGTRNWLKMAPVIRRRGGVVEITEEYLLSGPRGVNVDIYGDDALLAYQPK